MGIVLFVVANITLNITQDILYFPTVMMIGAFLVPVTFVVFFYQQEHLFDPNIHEQSNLPALDQTIIVRGLQSLATHAAWTGLIAATLWRERVRTGRPLTVRAVLFFLAAVVLHSLWDFASFSSNQTIVILAYVVLGGASLFLLFRRLWEARRMAGRTAQAD